MYKIHKLANIVAMAGDREQEALTADIESNDQQEPAVLWRSQIVDGRCRQVSCMALGKELKVRHLDDKLSEGEVASVVKSLNTRRNLTMTQKIVSAIRDQQRTGAINSEVAKQWAIGIATLKNGKYLFKHDPKIEQDLFDGKTVTITELDTKHKIVTNRINTLARIVKKNLEYGLVEEDTSESFEFNVEGRIKTESGKHWFYNKMKEQNIPNTAIGIRMDYIEFANLKFKRTE